jgi:hypothetical protein
VYTVFFACSRRFCLYPALAKSQCKGGCAKFGGNHSSILCAMRDIGMTSAKRFFYCANHCLCGAKTRAELLDELATLNNASDQLVSIDDAERRRLDSFLNGIATISGQCDCTGKCQCPIQSGSVLAQENAQFRRPISEWSATVVSAWASVVKRLTPMRIVERHGSFPVEMVAVICMATKLATGLFWNLPTGYGSL